MLALFFIIAPLVTDYSNYHFNINSILADSDRTQSLYNCLMNVAPCDLDGKVMRAFISEVVSSREDYPDFVKKYIDYLVDDSEERFLALAANYDTDDGIFRKLYVKHQQNLDRC